jgi:hypothetical protein
MRRISTLLIGLSLGASLTAAGWGQSATTRPVTSPVAAGPATLPADAGVTDPELGKLFRSRVAGIEFNPPANGVLIRDLNSGEIVRFMYPDSGWDVRAKTIPLHEQLRLSAGGDGGVLELMASQLLATNPAANIIRQQVIKVNHEPVGLIEARYNVGPDKVFTQQAIFPDNNELNLHYLLLQMTSRCDAKAVANVQDPLETDARKIFDKVLSTVKVLNRQELAEEQKKRYFDTKMLLVRLDRNKIIPAIQPLRLMRILHDGKDIGYIQMNARRTTHGGNEGFEVIVRSRVESEPSKPGIEKPATDTNPAATAGGIVLPGSVGPKPAAGNAGDIKPAGPSNVYTSSTFFSTFDRAHEDWTSITQVDDQVASQVVESANTDLTTHVDRAKAIAAQRWVPKPGEAPPDVTVPDYMLNIEYAHGRRQDKPQDIRLLPDYLPQALAQLLPRLLANEPGKYMFSFYVSGEQKLMRRYIDVDSPRDVTIDGNTVRAVPISDRIGVDGIPTIHYVTRDGEWLGSVNEDQKVSVLPSDETMLTDIWSKRPLGFKIADVPPPQEDTPIQPRKPAADQQSPAPGNMQGPTPMSR